jgi:hypothetical protein
LRASRQAWTRCFNGTEFCGNAVLVRLAAGETPATHESTGHHPLSSRKPAGNTQISGSPSPQGRPDRTITKAGTGPPIPLVKSASRILVYGSGSSRAPMMVAVTHHLGRISTKRKAGHPGPPFRFLFSLIVAGLGCRRLPSDDKRRVYAS